MKNIVQPFIKGFYCIVVVAALISCNNSKMPHTGIIKEAGTGLAAVYKNLEPGEILLTMNDQEINHTDIPLGESFMLVNDNTKGLTEKEGKFSVGCSLVIKDENGNELMNEPDLFKGNDILDASPTTRLRCTVNTGKPMKIEERYHVTVTFWDKYGDGNIVNTVTIRAIDIP